MSTTVPAGPESVFTHGAPALKFGPGASDEIGFDLAQHGVRRVLVITDTGVAATGAPHRIAERMTQFGIAAHVFDGVHVEPTDVSLQQAIDHATASGQWDAFVAVGGGSSIDTAKAVNLLSTNPGELMDYTNAPVGKALTPVSPLKPPVAVPTTGTGSEPERHIRAAEILAPQTERPNHPAEHLPTAIEQLTRDIGIPNGIAGVGYYKGAMKRQRLLSTAPRRHRGRHRRHLRPLAAAVMRGGRRWPSMNSPARPATTSR
ncbi:iron-containing alcohol dehydrogenase [Allosalinactinospora lopnorensis]|uniref:iron-containing alcohol dehydrogenase n=1 Tax=Allosalinactinospora lopnorensis TaxID=1352348 RepID=UPI000623C30B|nr:iron-containing alcohol dehydrogenase [Allosalinactinospora lopnorensis]